MTKNAATWLLIIWGATIALGLVSAIILNLWENRR